MRPKAKDYELFEKLLIYSNHDVLVNHKFHGQRDLVKGRGFEPQRRILDGHFLNIYLL